MHERDNFEKGLLGRLQTKLDEANLLKNPIDVELNSFNASQSPESIDFFDVKVPDYFYNSPRFSLFIVWPLTGEKPPTLVFATPQLVPPDHMLWKHLETIRRFVREVVNELEAELGVKLEVKLIDQVVNGFDRETIYQTAVDAFKSSIREVWGEDTETLSKLQFPQPTLEWEMKWADPTIEMVTKLGLGLLRELGRNGTPQEKINFVKHWTDKLIEKGLLFSWISERLRPLGGARARAAEFETSIDRGTLEYVLSGADPRLRVEKLNDLITTSSEVADAFVEMKAGVLKKIEELVLAAGDAERALESFTRSELRGRVQTFSPKERWTRIINIVGTIGIAASSLHFFSLGAHAWNVFLYCRQDAVSPGSCVNVLPVRDCERSVSVLVGCLGI